MEQVPVDDPPRQNIPTQLLRKQSSRLRVRSLGLLHSPSTEWKVDGNWGAVGAIGMK